MRRYLLGVFLCIGFSSLFGQSGIVVKTFPIKDTIQLEEVSISPFQFKVQSTDSLAIPPSFYTIDFPGSQLIPSSKLKMEQDSLLVTYFKYPEFLTKTYKGLDEKLIVDIGNPVDNLYELQQERQPSNFVLLRGSIQVVVFRGRLAWGTTKMQ